MSRTLTWLEEQVEEHPDDECPVQEVLFVSITTGHPYSPKTQQYAKTQMIETLGYELNYAEWYAEPGVAEPDCFVTRSAHSDQVSTILEKLNTDFESRGLGRVDVLICRPSIAASVYKTWC